MNSGPIINVDLLPEDTRKKVFIYLTKLINLLDDNIVSIFIYGSATGRNYVVGKSDINLAVVFKELHFSVLKKSLEVVSWGIAKKIPAPLMLTVRHIQTSTDAFPMEFLEMKNNHRLLYGQDLLKDLPIQESNLRLQCEQQLKGKLIRIRQAYLEAGLNKKRMRSLLRDSLNSIFPVFRGLLRIKMRQEPPTDKEQIINNMAKYFKIDREIFTSVLKETEISELFFEKYIKEIERLAIDIDQM